MKFVGAKIGRKIEATLIWDHAENLYFELKDLATQLFEIMPKYLYFEFKDLATQSLSTQINLFDTNGPAQIVLKSNACFQPGLKCEQIMNWLNEPNSAPPLPPKKYEMIKKNPKFFWDQTPPPCASNPFVKSTPFGAFAKWGK